MMMELADGSSIDALEVGARIRHRRHPELSGVVRAHEVHKESGKLSAMPYNVQWDDDAAASRKLGWLYIYATHDMVERAP